MTLERISGSTYYLPGPVNIGVYDHGDGNCTVIDTGIDKDQGRKILKALDEAGLTLVRIINTHAHADHFGANSYLLRRMGDRAPGVWAPEFEAGIIQFPQLEPFYLFSAHPLEELQTKFLQAPPSPVDRLVHPGERTPEGLQIVALPGHSPGQIGVVTPDGVFYCADAYFAQGTLSKYYLPYFVDVPRSKESLRQLLAQPHYQYYLPCHGHLEKAPATTITANLDRLEEIGEFIFDSLREPKTRETLLGQLVETHDLLLNTTQYHLYNSALGAHLSGLVEEGRVEFTLAQGKMFWKQK